MLTSLFYPENITLIGASRHPGKVGHDILKNLIDGGFEKEIFPVNPAGGTLFGKKVIKKLKEIESTIDLAIIVLPKTEVLSAAKDALAKGARSIVVVTSGFKEAGPDGLELERQLAEICRRNGARLLGPNCLGFINSHYALNGSFSGKMPQKGGIGVFSQSGALCTSILDRLKKSHLGLSKLISIGNKADIGEHDLLEYFADDPDTNVILGYLEDIVAGDTFVQTATLAATQKPIIILKAGSTEAGRRAAANHTGVLTTVDTAYGAAFKRSGIVRAENFEALFDYAAMFSKQPLPKGKRILVITNGGGPGAIAADALLNAGMEVAELASNPSASLRDTSPTKVSINNPVAVLGDAPPELYAEIFENGIADHKVDGILLVFTPEAMTNPEETIKAVVNIQNDSKPVAVSFMDGEIQTGMAETLKKAGIPIFPTPERGVASLGAMYQYSAWKSRPPRVVTRFKVNHKKAGHIITRSQANSMHRLSEIKAKKILEAYGFTVPTGNLVQSSQDAVEYAKRIGFPVAMKICSRDIVHKSEIGGVKLNVNNSQQVQDNYDLMMLRIHQQLPEAHLEGIYLEKMIDPGVEVILGMTRDAQFGPMLMFGLGGIFVEVMKDVTFHLAPVTHSEAIQMLQATKSYSLLESKNSSLDIDIIATALERISQLTSDYPQITEMEINPLIISQDITGPVVADAVIHLDPLAPPTL